MKTNKKTKKTEGREKKKRLVQGHKKVKKLTFPFVFSFLLIMNFTIQIYSKYIQI